MKKKILLGTLLAGILYLVARYVFQARLPNLGIIPNSVPNSQGQPEANVDSGEGCNSTYPIACGQLDVSDPQTNVGCCGEAVVDFQSQLQMLGQALSVDGRYGSQTAQAHQNALDEMGGTWFVSITETL